MTVSSKDGASVAYLKVRERARTLLGTVRGRLNVAVRATRSTWLKRQSLTV